MLEGLGKSTTSAGRRISSAAAALGVHLAVIFLAVRGTATPPAAASVVRDTIRLELGPIPERRLPPAPSLPPSAWIPAPPQQPAFRLEPPRLDQLLVETGRATLDPRALSGITDPGESVQPSAMSGWSGTVFSTTDVDQPPQLISGLQPRYPETLRHTSLTGIVQLQYVVSSQGRVEPGSLRVLQSTHREFTAAAIEALAAARFTPARRRGRTVSVLVQQTIRFVIR